MIYDFFPARKSICGPVEQGNSTSFNPFSLVRVFFNQKTGIYILGWKT